MSFTRRFLRPGVLPILMLLVLLAGALPRVAHADANSREQAQAKARLEAVKKQIAQLTRAQRDTATRRDKISAELGQQADRLNAAARAVRESDAAIAAKRKQLDALDAQRKPLDAKLHAQRAALGDLLRAAYALGHGSDLRLLLGDDDIARIGRALAYSRYFQRDRIQRIHSLMQDLAKLQDLQQRIAQEQQALEQERAQRQAHAQALNDARDQQRALLAKAQNQLKQQGRQLDQLKRNQKQLNDLIARLRNVFADIPRKLPDDTPFAKRRGHLPWPVRGKLTRSGDGVTIDAQRGSSVRAVAHGRVAFANWLRGYGMLIIVDHGNGWMSLYGDNESLLRDVGDWVDAGEKLGTVGVETGGHEGVYFGLRHKGKAVNPLPWLTRHR
ncbi:peptidoglycan DD-metalloendopeptidase family protein [Oleiagrimonas sp. MCCC 1A03011]|uniref:murein hydrolase activator EnvC family protein n=1 Tax=Oleiagrimonas sp. MCCC 1A03011 TaxID=1926883 RepID=UPI000DC4E00A|nr:peptidoglycan DD-metalloendopeptidase family protein [Oleiagrimonas sp. MCCC 1A03011]RAP58182.1 hypothetical protein BTJ49_04150 [Oleiagrimonas sp. MCCC 1A03011]